MEPQIPPQSLGRLFLRFLRFGFLAWGGPVAQIAMIRHELVEEEKWITRERFNRVLAVYQALPGPEAHELCVYFGMLARGRIGAVLAGLGFMLPGFALMFALSVLYSSTWVWNPWVQAAFLAMQAAVAALIVRAIVRIGEHALLDGWLWMIGLAAFASQVLGEGAHFALVLLASGLAYLIAREVRWRWLAIVPMVAVMALPAALALREGRALISERLIPSPARSEVARSGTELDARSGRSASGGQDEGPVGAPARTGEQGASDPASAGDPSHAATVRGAAQDEGAPKRTASSTELFGSGLRTGLLTFGGAYTAIPFLHRDAVEAPDAWMTEQQFLDGLALGGILPAPLIIFSTFVGYRGGGPLGAWWMTLGVFLPAFAFTLLGHRHLERWVESEHTRHFLAGITAAVVGLIAGTTVELLVSTLRTVPALGIFAGALAALFFGKGKAIIPLVVLGAAVVGLALHGAQAL